jgi:hypothetical protein
MRSIARAFVLALGLTSGACAGTLGHMLGQAGITPPNSDNAPSLPESQSPVLTDTMYVRRHGATAYLAGEVSLGGMTKECVYRRAGTPFFLATSSLCQCPMTIAVPS